MGTHERDQFAEGYRLGYATGRELGYQAAEHDMAVDWERWRSTIGDLTESDEASVNRRVRAAERYSRARADRHADQFNRRQKGSTQRAGRRSR